MLNKYLRLLFIGLAQLTDPILAANSNSLPKECQKLELVTGDPVTSRRVMFGETHLHQPCLDSIYECASVLFSKEKYTAGFFESVPVDKILPCEYEQEQSKPAKLFSECRGWDMPEAHAKQSRFQEVKMKFEAFREIENHFSNILQLLDNPEVRVNDKLNLIKQIIKKLKDSNKFHSKRKNKKFNDYEIKHSNIKRSELYLHESELIERTNFEIDLFKKIISQVEMGIPFDEVFAAVYTQVDQSMWATMLKEMNTDNIIINERNKYLSALLNQNLDPKIKIGIFGGKGHFNSKQAAELRQELDKHKDLIPYAILQCKT